ncbi:MAG: TlpA family protein disulfide reductase [Chloroflexi bacterium]|nr:TlpA family protein disulfide reductase [Chloroflexota bacterium]
MPEFEAAYQANKDRGFVIVGVNNGETPQAVTAFRADQRVTFPLVMDESFAISDEYVVQQFPTTYVIGRDGTIRARNYGALTAEQISQFVDDALAS